MKPSLNITTQFNIKKILDEDYNVSIAKVICKTFLQKCDFYITECQVDKNNIEHNTLPSFFATSLNNDHKISATFIDVKYMKFLNYNDFLESINNGMLKNKAVEYMQQENSIYFFLFVYFEED